MINYSGSPPFRRDFVYRASDHIELTLLKGKKQKYHISISHNPQLTSKVPEKSKLLCEMPDICASGLVI